MEKNRDRIPLDMIPCKYGHHCFRKNCRFFHADPAAQARKARLAGRLARIVRDKAARGGGPPYAEHLALAKRLGAPPGTQGSAAGVG